MFYHENAQEVIWHYIKIKWKFNKFEIKCMYVLYEVPFAAVQD